MNLWAEWWKIEPVSWRLLCCTGKPGTRTNGIEIFVENYFKRKRGAKQVSVSENSNDWSKNRSPLLHIFLGGWHAGERSSETVRKISSNKHRCSKQNRIHSSNTACPIDILLCVEIKTGSRALWTAFKSGGHSSRRMEHWTGENFSCKMTGDSPRLCRTIKDLDESY